MPRAVVWRERELDPTPLPRAVVWREKELDPQSCGKRVAHASCPNRSTRSPWGTHASCPNRSTCELPKPCLREPQRLHGKGALGTQTIPDGALVGYKFAEKHRHTEMFHPVTSLYPPLAQLWREHASKSLQDHPPKSPPRSPPRPSRDAP